MEGAAKKRVDVFDPSTGKKITDIADCDAADAMAAVDAADKAASRLGRDRAAPARRNPAQML